MSKNRQKLELKEQNMEQKHNKKNLIHQMKEKMSRTFHKHKFEMKLQQSYQFEFKKNDAWKIYNTKSKQFRTFEKITKRIFLWKIY